MSFSDAMSLRLAYEYFRENSRLQGYVFVACVGLLGAVGGFAYGMLNGYVIFSTLIGWILGIILTALGIWSYPKD